MLTRRSFLRALGIGTGVAIVAPELLVPEEPRRRVWQVGAALTPSAATWAPGLWQKMDEAVLLVPQRAWDNLNADLAELRLNEDHGFAYAPRDALHLGDETALGDEQIKQMLERSFIKPDPAREVYEAKLARAHAVYYGADYPPSAAAAAGSVGRPGQPDSEASLYSNQTLQQVVRLRDEDGRKHWALMDAVPTRSVWYTSILGGKA